MTQQAKPTQTQAAGQGAQPLRNQASANRQKSQESDAAVPMPAAPPRDSTNRQSPKQAHELSKEEWSQHYTSAGDQMFSTSLGTTIIMPSGLDEDEKQKVVPASKKTGQVAQPTSAAQEPEMLTHPNKWNAKEVQQWILKEKLNLLIGMGSNPLKGMTGTELRWVTPRKLEDKGLFLSAAKNFIRKRDGLLDKAELLGLNPGVTLPDTPAQSPSPTRQP